MNPKLLGVLALVAGQSVGPCDEGVLSVGVSNPGEYLRQGEAYTATCYLVDPKAGGCKELLDKELSQVPSRANAVVPILAQGGRLLSQKTDQGKGATWCEFKAPAGCSYQEISGNLVVIVSRAEGLNPEAARPIADGCKANVAVGTGKRLEEQVRLSRRSDAPAEIAVPNPHP